MKRFIYLRSDEFIFVILEQRYSFTCGRPINANQNHDTKMINTSCLLRLPLVDGLWAKHPHCLVAIGTTIIILYEKNR